MDDLQIPNAIGFFVCSLFPIGILLVHADHLIGKFQKLNKYYPKNPKPHQYRPTGIELLLMTIDPWDAGFILMCCILAFIPLILSFGCFYGVLSNEDVQLIKEIIHELAN